MKKLILLLVSLLALVLSREYQGAQVIDSKQSYMFNLRYSNISKKLYYRADKSSPNVFTATTDGPEATKFKINTHSPLSATTSAFFAFDVITHNNVDYIIGSTLDSMDAIALPLLVASTAGYNSPLVPYSDKFLYTPAIDTASVVSDKVDVYFAGWSFDPARFGLIVAKAVAVLTNNPSISVTAENVLLINDTCFDVWTEINKPHLYIDIIGGAKYLILAVTGRCDGFYRIKIDPTFSKSSYLTYTESDTLNSDIFATTYDYQTQKLYYAFKKYNSQNNSISLHNFLVNPFTPSTLYLALQHNDSNPVLAFDRGTNSLFFASSDFDHVYRMVGSNTNITIANIATLPPKLKSVSSMITIGDFLYLVTYEADAQLGRIQISQHFCNHFCGPHGYCAAKPDLCQCAPGFVYNITQHPSDIKECVPKHEVDIMNNIVTERGVAIALGILFFVAFIAAIAGWVMWWRSRKALYSSMR